MSDKKIMRFELSPKDLKVKEILKGEFLNLDIYAISDANPNVNHSHFTPESMVEAIPTFYNKPILGAFKDNIGPMGDFDGHNDNGLCYDPELQELYYDYSSEDSEIPLGMIRESDNVQIVKDPKTGLSWIKFTCCLWVKYNYKAIKSLLKSRKGTSCVSVEIEVLDSYFDDKGIEHIVKFNFMGCTILGQQVSPGIEGAHLSVLDYLESKLFSRKQRALAFAYSALDEYNKVESPITQDSNIKNNEQNIINVDESLQQCASVFENKDNEEIANENPEEEIIYENSKEGGNNPMNLTTRAKMDLLDGYLREALVSEECEYVWVCDLDDTYVYFEYNDVTYRATYLFTEADENNSVYVDLENKEVVIRSWEKFSEEEVPEQTSEVQEFSEENAQGDNKSEFEEVHEENSEKTFAENSEEAHEETFEEAAKDYFGACKCEENEPCKCEENEPCKCEENKPDGEPHECAAEGPEKVTKEAENVDDKDDADDKDNVDNKDTEACKCEENQEMCGTQFAKGIDITEEPEPIDLSITAGLEAATKSISAPPVQQDADYVGDCNKAVAENMPGEVIEAISDGSVTLTSEVSKGPNGESATVVTQPEETAELKQPDDSDKERDNFQAKDTIEVDGVEVNVNQLFEMYSDLKSKYEAAIEQLNNSSAEKLANFGADFINSDADVDDENRKIFIEQTVNKCKSFELTTEEEVTKFAKSLLAMYFYENRQSHKATKAEVEFSIPIDSQSCGKDSMASKSKLEEAIYKLNHI